MSRARYLLSVVLFFSFLCASRNLLSARPAAFVRGDCNQDGGVDVGDVAFLFFALVGERYASTCDDACDADDSGGAIDLGDVVYLLRYLFSGAAPPHAPFTVAGLDPTAADGLACESYRGSAAPRPVAGTARGVFLSEADLLRIEGALERDDERAARLLRNLRGRADSALVRGAEPFSMPDVGAIRFGWCESPAGADDTLKELVKKLESDTNHMRNLALYFALAGEERYAAHAVAMLLEWAERSTLVNLYDFDPDFVDAAFDGVTDDGFCGERPWNFALDASWQAYGLINVADAYLLLTRNGYRIDPGDEARIRAWLHDLTDAVNAGLHAWTRWADAHPRSSSLSRYRSDNHLSWCLAGLLAAAASLGDAELAGYCLEGGVWEDRRAGPYANPSHIRDLLERAIEAEGENAGRIYEERIGRDPPLGYALFHLWPMCLVARLAEVHFGEDLWEFRGDDGAGLKEAFERYSAFALGERAAQPPEDLGSYLWLWQFAALRWPQEPRYRAVLALGSQEKFILQSIGPVALVLGGLDGQP